MSHLEPRPAEGKPSTGEHDAVTVKKRKFTKADKAQFQRITAIAEQAVHAIRYPAEATEQDHYSLKLLTDADVVTIKMSAKEMCKSIGALRRTIDDLIAGNGAEVEWIKPLNYLLLVHKSRPSRGIDK